MGTGPTAMGAAGDLALCPTCQSLSLWERWHHESDDGEGENADLYAFSLRNFSMKSTSLSTPSAGMAL